MRMADIAKPDSAVPNERHLVALADSLPPAPAESREPAQQVAAAPAIDSYSVARLSIF